MTDQAACQAAIEKATKTVQGGSPWVARHGESGQWCSSEGPAGCPSFVRCPTCPKDRKP